MTPLVGPGDPRPLSEEVWQNLAQDTSCVDCLCSLIFGDRDDMADPNGPAGSPAPTTDIVAVTPPQDVEPTALARVIDAGKEIAPPLMKVLAACVFQDMAGPVLEGMVVTEEILKEAVGIAAEKLTACSLEKLQTTLEPILGADVRIIEDRPDRPGFMPPPLSTTSSSAFQTAPPDSCLLYTSPSPRD